MLNTVKGILDISRQESIKTDYCKLMSVIVSGSSRGLDKSFAERLNNVIHSSIEFVLEGIYFNKSSALVKESTSIFELLEDYSEKPIECSSSEELYESFYKMFCYMYKYKDVLLKQIDNVMRGTKVNITNSKLRAQDVLSKVLLFKLVENSIQERK